MQVWLTVELLICLEPEAPIRTFTVYSGQPSHDTPLPSNAIEPRQSSGRDIGSVRKVK